MTNTTNIFSVEATQKAIEKNKAEAAIRDEARNTKQRVQACNNEIANCTIIRKSQITATSVVSAVAVYAASQTTQVTSKQLAIFIDNDLCFDVRHREKTTEARVRNHCKATLAKKDLATYDATSDLFTFSEAFVTYAQNEQKRVSALMSVMREKNKAEISIEEFDKLMAEKMKADEKADEKETVKKETVKKETAKKETKTRKKKEEKAA